MELIVDVIITVDVDAKTIVDVVEAEIGAEISE